MRAAETRTPVDHLDCTPAARQLLYSRFLLFRNFLSRFCATRRAEACTERETEFVRRVTCLVVAPRRHLACMLTTLLTTPSNSRQSCRARVVASRSELLRATAREVSHGRSSSHSSSSTPFLLLLANQLIISSYPYISKAAVTGPFRLGKPHLIACRI